MSRWILFAMIVLTAGCGPFISVIKVDKQTAEKLREAIPLLSEGEIRNFRYERIGVLSATSCKSMFWHPAASEEDAVNQLRFKAERQGAEALSNLNCADTEGTSFQTNCWNTVTCRVVAIRNLLPKASEPAIQVEPNDLELEGHKVRVKGEGE